ncbi:NAD(+)/NADH kinase [Clostridium sardiniense]|uniref:NAD kinase n=1 Tax=Clostridium sardiniense TaxID=29369 RepID=A0ABS7KW55_CLOSR|nr:NAD(+)/NADH kinase [Clostridium sardiniense]MBY0754822.1 NAD(+)/NADH kinase [Clostridium sardiniense]MDQ0462010.1 NAD+ kinase [Clostridium sardiniense]
MRHIGIAINPSKDCEGIIVNLVIEKLNKAFDKVKIDIFNTYEIKCSDLSKNIELLIVLGGDGTLLGVARKISNKMDIPLLGINIGNLGFLSSIDISEIDKAIFKLKNDLFKVEERMLLKCKINDVKNDEQIALNDIVIARGTLSRMTKFNIYVDGKYYSSFKGDGLIIATPTGSTAYSFSAGGPFIYPDLDVILITPICPHTKSMQTMVLRGDSKITIKTFHEEEELYLTVDGQKVYEVDKKAIIKISRAEREAKLVQFDDYDYFEVLRTKILNK